MDLISFRRKSIGISLRTVCASLFGLLLLLFVNGRSIQFGTMWTAIIILKDMSYKMNGVNARCRNVMYIATSIIYPFIHRFLYHLEIHFLIIGEDCPYQHWVTTCQCPGNVLKRSILGTQRTCWWRSTSLKLYLDSSYQMTRWHGVGVGVGWCYPDCPTFCYRCISHLFFWINHSEQTLTKNLLSMCSISNCPHCTISWLSLTIYTFIPVFV